MVFKPGDEITVRPDKKDFWLNGLEHKETTYTVREVSYATFPCCVGHVQSLVSTNGNHFSAAWFDMDLVGKPEAWCHGNHYGDYGYGSYDWTEDC